jgi:hypothetical protein
MPPTIPSARTRSPRSYLWTPRRTIAHSSNRSLRPTASSADRVSVCPGPTIGLHGSRSRRTAPGQPVLTSVSCERRLWAGPRDGHDDPTLLLYLLLAASLAQYRRRPAHRWVPERVSETSVGDLARSGGRSWRNGGGVARHRWLGPSNRAAILRHLVIPWPERCVCGLHKVEDAGAAVSATSGRCSLPCPACVQQVGSAAVSGRVPHCVRALHAKVVERCFSRNGGLSRGRPVRRSGSPPSSGDRQSSHPNRPRTYISRAEVL